MKNLSKKTISLMLVFVILMSTFLPTFASALNYDLPEWNETDHTVNSYNVTSDVVTLYVGNISVDGTSVLKYLYTDKSVNTTTLTEIGKILTTDYAAILPTTEGQIAVSNDNTVNINDTFTDAGMAGVNMYPDKTPTDTSATILYNQTVFNSLATASATEVSDEQTAEANNLSAYNTRKTAWEDAEQAKVAADSDYTPVAFPEEYKNAFNDTTSYPSDSYFIVDNKGSAETSYIIRNGVVTQVDTYPINRTIVKVVNTSADVVTTPTTYEEYNLWVGGTRVTSTNKGNILGDGKVTYNPTTHTLNFNDATIEDYYVRTDDNDAKCNIFAKDIDLIITGKVNFPSTEVRNSIAILSSSTPNISATINADITFSREIWVYGNLTIAGGSLTRTINGSAIYANGTLTIGSGISKIDVMSYIGGYEGITIEDPLVITSPEGLTITNGVTTSIGGLSVYDNTRIVIEHPPVSASYEVTFNTDGGTPVPATQYISDGEKVTKPATDPQKDGWTFVRWCEDSTRNTAFDFEHVAIEKNTTVYAQYVKNVTVTIDVNGGNPLTKTKCTGTAGQTLAEILGELMSITPSHPDGKVLVGLNDVDGDGNETPLDMSGIEDMEVTEDMTLKFVWGDAITSLDFTVTPPTAGTTTNTPKDEYNDYVWDEQTNKPVVAIPTGVHYALNGDPCAYWVSGYEEAQIVIPFIGTFEAGNRYNIHAFLTIDDGYAMTEDCTITLNGEETEKIIIAEGLDPETGAHILEIGLNVEIPSNEVTVTIDPNGGNELDRPYYHGTKGKSLSVIIAEFYNGDEPTYPNGDKRFWGFEDADGNIIYDIDNLTENITIYCHWRDVVKEIDITLASPLAGTTTTTDKDGDDWDYDNQTNPPEVSVPSGVNYELDTEDGEYLPAYWVENFVYQGPPFVGTFVQGQTYKAEIYLKSLNGYLFAKDVKVKINGEETGTVIYDDGGWLIVGGNVEVLPTYKVTFHPNGGSVSPTTKEYQEGAKLGTLPVPTRSGWGFTGWYNWFWKLVYENPFRDSYYGRNVLRLAPGSSPTGSGIFGVGQTLVFDVTINNTIPVSIDVADRDVAVGNGYTIDGNRVYGQIELTASLLGSGYSFLDINCADGVTSYVINDFKLFPAGVSPDPITSDTVMGASDMTVMAAWTPGSSTVSFNTDGGSEIAPQAVKTGAYATRPTEKPVKDGYKFEDWYVDSDFSARFNFSTAINGDTVVYARYIKLIKEVNITAELPKLGETITKEGSKQVPQLVLTVDGEGYKMPETETGLMMYWLDPAGEGLADGLEIEPETGYQVVLFAIANKGYAFADDVVVKINGVATTVFDMGEANEGMEILATITTDSLKIIGGKDQTHIKGTSDGLTITCNGGFRQFRGLRVGTTELDASAFDSKAGSTIITLKPDYLNSLELGTYQISFLYQGDRECSTNFTIAKANEPAQGGGGGGQTSAPAATNSPVTGDTITVWILIMTMSGLAMIGIIYNLRRKNR